MSVGLRRTDVPYAVGNGGLETAAPWLFLKHAHRQIHAEDAGGAAGGAGLGVAI